MRAEVLARDDDGGDGYNFRIAHTVSAGTYYIKVEGYDASTTGSYTIHASGPGGGDDGGLGSPNGIALDVAAGKMYWTDTGTNKIQRANLGGSQIETLISTGLENPVRYRVGRGGRQDVLDGGWRGQHPVAPTLTARQVETLVAKDPSGGGGAISLSISGSLYPVSDLLNRKRPVE